MVDRSLDNQTSLGTFMHLRHCLELDVPSRSRELILELRTGASQGIIPITPGRAGSRSHLILLSALYLDFVDRSIPRQAQSSGRQTPFHSGDLTTSTYS